MLQYIDILKDTQLFTGVNKEEITAMLQCLQARKRICPKGTRVFREGEYISHLAITVAGKLFVQQNDFWGNRTILNVLGPGEMFGDAYATPDSGPLQFDVIAEEDCVIILFDIQRILTVCSSACRFHTMIVQNLFFAISNKNRLLVQKISHLSKRSTRAKLLSYLSTESKRQRSSRLTIPFSRQQLADYLCVDRSAMSNELCKMRDEGILSFYRNEFTLHHREYLS